MPYKHEEKGLAIGFRVYYIVGLLNWTLNLASWNYNFLFIFNIFIISAFSDVVLLILVNGGMLFRVETSDLGQLKFIELILIGGFRCGNFPKVAVKFVWFPS